MSLGLKKNDIPIKTRVSLHPFEALILIFLFGKVAKHRVCSVKNIGNENVFQRRLSGALKLFFERIVSRSLLP
jgi:hypothetical protein